MIIGILINIKLLLIGTIKNKNFKYLIHNICFSSLNDFNKLLMNYSQICSKSKYNIRYACKVLFLHYFLFLYYFFFPLIFFVNFCFPAITMQCSLMADK